MSNRHKRIVATLDTGTSADWNADHEINYMLYISEELLRLGDPLATIWDTAETIDGAVPVWVLVGAAGSEHATVELNTGADTGHISSMRYMLDGAVSNVTSPNDLPVLTMAVQIDTVDVTGKTVEFGFVPSATTPFTANQAGAYFRVNNNTLYAVTGTGAAETATSLGAYNEYDHYRIEFMSTLVNFYVGSVATPVAIHTTHRPVVALTAKVSVISVNDTDSTIRSDAIGLTRLRLQ